MSNLSGEYPNQLTGIDGVNDTNAGAINQLALGTRIGGSTTAAVVISSGTGAPTIGGNVGDLWIRTTDGTETTYFYRCTGAGVAGVAVWTAMGSA